MPLTGPRDMFAKALAGGFAVGAFNINNMETVQGILQAAGDERSPVILQVSNGARQYAGRGYLRKMAEAASEETDVPFVLHLDHGSGFDICKACIDDGFTSVMIDGSHLPFEENVVVTRRVVEYAHDRGVWVEAELGRLAGVEETVSSRESVYTDPEEAETFVARTGCDSLAIAIGTSFRGRRGLISSALTPLPPVCRAFRWCCTARRACRRRPWLPSTRTAGM